MKKVGLIVILFCCTFSNAYCQNAFGALLSNYTPTNSLYINPSSILDSKVWIDINLAGGGAYANNNLVYLQNHSGISAINDARKEVPTINEDDLGYNQSRKRYHGYIRAFAAGPSLVWSQGDHAFGLSTGARGYAALRNLPDYGAQFIEHGVPEYTVQHDIEYHAKDVRFAVSTFGELKLTYAYTFLKRGRDMFMAGASFSKLFSIVGGGINIYSFDFLVDNDSIIEVFNLEGDALYSVNERINARGGWGIDIGFTYQKMLRDCSRYYPNSPKSGCTDIPYKYKIGLSVMDMGTAKYTPYYFAGYNFTLYDWYHYTEEEVNEDNPTDIFAPQEATINEGTVNDPYKIRLPTFISGQFDYNIWASRLYVNATVIQGFGVPRHKFGIRHANSISITPRFESFWFDFALPFSLYEYQYPQLGASLRLGPITVGTDKLINWLFRKDIYGADIYVYLKLPFRYHPKCGDRMKSLRKRSKFGDPTDCTI